MNLRNIRESDYHPIISVIDEWWGGRQMADMLPRLFFVHFQTTSFVIEANDRLLAFLIGFISQSHPHEAYIHFVGVNPEFRKQGLGERLYNHFFEVVRQQGCVYVSCVTSPVNKGSIAFHTRLGFSAQPGDEEIDGISVKSNYDGNGQPRVVFNKKI